MRINEIITENLNEWREAYLYHATSITAAIRIWQNDNLQGGTGPANDKKNSFSGVSTTRNYNYALGYLRGFSYDDTGGVIFWIDQDKVKRDLGRRRLRGYDWFVDNNPDDVSSEFQRRSDFNDTDRFETVITKGGLKPFRPYVAKIEIWLPKTSDKAPPPPNASEQERWDWENNLGKYSSDYKNPDKGRINIRPDQDKINKWLTNPLDRKTWEALLKDSRTDVKSTPGLPHKHLGKFIHRKVQYDTEHPMYGGS